MGNETSKCQLLRTARGDFSRYLTGHGLDIGCGKDPLRIVDGTLDTWDLPQGDAQLLRGLPDEKFDFVYSSHCLEHLHSIDEALNHWARVIKPGGYLYVTVPDYALYEKFCFPSRFNSDHKHTFSLTVPRRETRRKNHWHIEQDLAPLLLRLGIRLLETRLEDNCYDYALAPEIDQTGNARTLAQICFVGIKEGTRAPFFAHQSQIAPELTPEIAERFCAQDGIPSKAPLALVVEGGIGDVLTSFSAMRWIRQAYPDHVFCLFVMEHSPGRAQGMRSIAETHPELAAVRIIDSLDKIGLYFGPQSVKVLNISPWHFLTACYRAIFPSLDYYLTSLDLEVARQYITQLGAKPILLQPLASNPKVNWPIERWRELADKLARRHPVVVVGGPDGTPIPEATHDLQGKLTLRESVALATQAAGVVAARSFISIVSMDADIPTLVLTPPTRLHEIRDYAYPPAYFARGTAALLDSAASANRAEECLFSCLSKAGVELRNQVTDSSGAPQ